MTTTKMLIKTIMDGITDAGMMLDYAEEAKENAHDDAASFFRMHAKKRIEQTESDAEKMSDILGLRAKMAAGDEMAAALMGYVKDQTETLEKRYMAL